MIIIIQELIAQYCAQNYIIIVNYVIEIIIALNVRTEQNSAKLVKYHVINVLEIQGFVMLVVFVMIKQIYVWIAIIREKIVQYCVLKHIIIV